MITKVRLRNWKSHLESELGFSSGVNVLVGLMGAGKSSVMDAVAFGLFGSFPALQGRRVVLDELIMARPQKKGEAGVEVEFQADGKKYLVKRDLKRGKGSSAEIREGGVLKEVSSRGVTREVERILGMDYEVFSRAVYSEQNGIDYFLKIPAGKRREHIDRMLRVDRFEIVRSEAVALQNRLKAGREEKLRIAAEMEKEGLGERIEKLGKEIKVFREEVLEMEKSREELEKERKGFEERLEGFEKNEKELEQARRLLEGLKGGLEEIRNREGKSRKVVRGMDLGKMDLEAKRLELGIEGKRKDIDSLKEEIHSREGRKSVASESLEKLEVLGDKCPLCESEIAPRKKAMLVDGRKRLLDDLEGEVAKRHASVFEKGKELDILEKSLGEKRAERERISQAFQEIKELEEKLKEIIATKSNYEERIQGLEEVFLGVDVKALRESLQGIVSREGKISVEIRSREERAADREQSRKELAERNELLKAYRKELEEGERISRQLGDFGNALKLTQEELRREFLKSVNLILESVWRELYPYGDFDSVRLGVVGGDYSLQLKAGDWVDAEAVSGGERSLACLALRIGFSLAFLPNLRWLILDEPTHNLDSNAIRAFGMALREKIPSFAGQVFLITHDSSLSEGIENVHLLERDKAKGEATSVKRF